MTQPSDSVSSNANSFGLLAPATQRDNQAWTRLAYVFGPLTYSCCRRMQMQPSSVKALIPDMFHVVRENIGDVLKEKSSDSFLTWQWAIKRQRIEPFQANDQQSGVNINAVRKPTAIVLHRHREEFAELLT